MVDRDMRRNMKQWVEGLIASPRRSAIPVMTYPGLELLGKTITEVIRDGAAQFACIRALAKRFPSAATVNIMDLSVEAEAFGCPIECSDLDVPTVRARIVTDAAGVPALRIPEVGEGRTGVYIEAARLAAQGIDDRPVFAGQIGPISLAGRVYGMSEIMLDLMLEPAAIHELLDKCATFLGTYAQVLKGAGANGIIIAEPAAGLLSPAACEEFSSRYVKTVVESVQDESFMVILHNCGNTRKLVPSMAGTGAMGFHFGNAVDMLDVLPQVPPECIALGNIDPANVFNKGSAADVRSKTTDLLRRTAAFPNYVLSSGCDVPPKTPIGNVEAFYEALAEFNA